MDQSWTDLEEGYGLILDRPWGRIWTDLEPTSMKDMDRPWWRIWTDLEPTLRKDMERHRFDHLFWRSLSV